MEISDLDMMPIANGSDIFLEPLKTTLSRCYLYASFQHKNSIGFQQKHSVPDSERWFCGSRTLATSQPIILGD